MEIFISKESRLTNHIKFFDKEDWSFYYVYYKIYYNSGIQYKIFSKVDSKRKKLKQHQLPLNAFQKAHFKIMNLYLLFLFMPLHTCVQFRTKCNLRPSRRVILCQFLMYRLPFTWYKSQDKCNNWKNNKKLETLDNRLYLTKPL